MEALAEDVARAAGDERGAARLLAATARTAAQCRLDPAEGLGLGRVHFPEERLVGAAPGSAGRVLRARCEQALRVRGYERSPVMRERLAQELGTIGALGWPTYFLTVARVVDDARALGVRVQARGSAAGSLVVHLLGISVAEPVSNGLIMERFLNRRRKSLPDIDVDVESARRIEVYRAVLDRFGSERVAAVAMPETYRVRHALRAAGLALGLAPDEVGQIAKSFPHLRARDARSALRELPELRELSQRADRYGRLWELAEGLDGLTRGVAMHPCGVLLSDASLLARTPVQPTAQDALPMSSFDKDDAERLGLLKLDILGVRMQSSMAYAVSEIRRTTGQDLDLDDRAQVPLEDPQVFEMLNDQGVGGMSVFQLESPGQRELTGRLHPETFQDLTVQIALFRPGPVQADMIRPYIEARHGRRRPRYPHPDLEPALAVTCGVLVFNEQVIQVVATMTRTDLAMGEEARRALSDPQRLPGLEAWFRCRARQAGYAPPVVDEVWNMLKNMGSFGFARAHSVAFALATVQSAYLKAHFPAPFYAGVLEHDPGMYPKRLVLTEARRRGVPVLPVDVQHSSAHYRVEALPDGRLGLRIALADIHGITDDEAARITAQQPYADLADFYTRAQPSLPLAQGLARIGALDTLAPAAHRRELLLQVDELHRQHRRPAVTGQLTLTTEPSTAASVPTGLPAMTEQEQLAAELEVLGMDTSRHLMSVHHRLLTELGVMSADRLAEVPTGETVLVAGAKVATQTPPTKSGRRTIFASLDDGSPGGVVDLVFFDDTHEHVAAVVFHRWLLVVRGTVQRRGTSISIVGERAWSLVDLVQARQDGGPAALRTALTANDPQPSAPTDGPGPRGGDGTAGRRLWHASPGSAG